MFAHVYSFFEGLQYRIFNGFKPQIYKTGSSCSKRRSLTSSLVVKMVTVLVITISNSQIFLLKTCVAFANAKAAYIFSANILAYMPYLMIKDLTIR